MTKETKTAKARLAEAVVLLVCIWFFGGTVIGAVLMVTRVFPGECQDGLRVVACE
ncbi:MAG TPA: hypothetical protein VI320_21690 [Terracidiphilus sp.]|jgi:hypothetical protein